MFADSKTARDAIHNMYLELIDGIPINLLLPNLRQANVIDMDDQVILDKMASDADKTHYLLDEKIIKQLKDNRKQPFEELLHEMEKCTNNICNSLAFELQVESGKKSVPTPEATISPGGNVQ